MLCIIGDDLAKAETEMVGQMQFVGLRLVSVGLWISDLHLLLMEVVVGEEVDEVVVVL